MAPTLKPASPSSPQPLAGATLLVVAFPSPTIGGSYRWLEDVMAALPERGLRCVVAAPDFPDYPAATFLSRFPAAEGIVLEAPTATPAGRQGAVERLLLRLRPDIVVPHLLADVYGGLCRARRAGAPTRLLYAAHEISPAILADVLDHAVCLDAAVAVSRGLERIIVDVAGLAAERVWRVPYGVPSPSRPRAAQEGGPLRIGYAGRLDPDKRAEDLVPICHGLAAGLVDYRLEIVGEGSCESLLRAALAAEASAGRVSFSGARSREWLYERGYPRWDCLLRASATEGFPIAITEAMVNGCVPVVSDFEGRAVEGVLRHLETAVVFPVGDARRAVDELRSLSLDRGLLTRLSLATRAEAEGYTQPRMLQGWSTALHGALSRPARPACGSCPGPGPGGRLDAWLPAGAAEAVRRVLGRQRAPMPWPFTYHGGDAVADRLRLRVEALLRGAESAPTQDC